jgi:hypothetical protein
LDDLLSGQALFVAHSHLYWACSFQLDIEVTPTYVLFGGGALLALLILSKIVSAIDSVPLVCGYAIVG